MTHWRSWHDPLPDIFMILARACPTSIIVVPVVRRILTLALNDTTIPPTTTPALRVALALPPVVLPQRRAHPSVLRQRVVLHGGSSSQVVTILFLGREKARRTGEGEPWWFTITPPFLVKERRGDMRLFSRQPTFSLVSFCTPTSTK